MSKASSMNRVSTMVSRLNEGKKLSITELSYEFETSDRTIRRDIALIQEVFGEFLINDRGTIYAIKRDLLADVLSPAELSLLKDTLRLAERSGLSLANAMDKKEREKLIGKIRESEKIYIFKTRPFEEFRSKQPMFEQLEKAIKHKWIIKMEYDKDGSISNFTARPYAIVFVNENFYLASDSYYMESSTLLLSRIAMIRNVVYTGEYFERDRKFEIFINEFQTAWANYRPQLDGNYKKIEVMLEVNSEIARYFRFKKYLPSQEIVETLDNGSIRVKYTVSGIFEMIQICKHWIGSIKVIYPRSLRMKLLEEATKAVENLKDWEHPPATENDSPKNQ